MHFHTLWHLTLLYYPCSLLAFFTAINPLCFFLSLSFLLTIIFPLFLPSSSLSLSFSTNHNACVSLVFICIFFSAVLSSFSIIFLSYRWTYLSSSPSSSPAPLHMSLLPSHCSSFLFFPLRRPSAGSDGKVERREEWREGERGDSN